MDFYFLREISHCCYNFHFVASLFNDLFNMASNDWVYYYLKLASASFAGDTRHQARSRIAYCKRLITK